MFGATGEFQLDLPVGRYEIAVTAGNPMPFRHDRMGIFLENGQVEAINSPTGQVVTRTYFVTVADGTLNIALQDLGGGDPNVVIEALVVRPADDPTEWTFDFGTSISPVEQGYVGLSSSSLYSEAVGYGWQNEVESFDNGGSVVTGDFNYTGSGHFMVDLPAGRYEVVVTVGNPMSFPHNLMGILLEGGQADAVDTSAGQVVTRTYFVTVSDGTLDLHLQDLGGSDQNVVVEALEIREVPEPQQWHFDFGTSTSPVTEGYIGHSNHGLYAAAIGYGWQLPGVSAYDSGGDSLTGDFHYMSENNFLVDVPAETTDYVITLQMGNPLPFGHDQMSIWLEGKKRDTVDTLSGEVVIRTYLATVTDGQLTLGLWDLGGRDANAVVEALDVIPVSQGGAVSGGAAASLLRDAVLTDFDNQTAPHEEDLLLVVVDSPRVSTRTTSVAVEEDLGGEYYDEVLTELSRASGEGEEIAIVLGQWES